LYGLSGGPESSPDVQKVTAWEKVFNRTLLEEFYQIAMLKNIYTTLDELQHYLDKFIYYYNFKRTNQGYRLKGKVPYMRFLDGTRKFALPESG
jgi:hypothetical protein